MKPVMELPRTVKQKKAQMSPQELAAANKKWAAFQEQMRKQIREEYHLPEPKVKPLPSLEKLGREPKPNQS
jgi:hypothetical protein